MGHNNDTCPHCGEEIYAAEDYCPHCGEPLYAAPQSRRYNARRSVRSHPFRCANGETVRMVKSAAQTVKHPPSATLRGRVSYTGDCNA